MDGALDDSVVILSPHAGTAYLAGGGGGASRSEFEKAVSYFDARPDLVRIKSDDVVVVYVGRGLPKNQPDLARGLSR